MRVDHRSLSFLCSKSRKKTAKRIRITVPEDIIRLTVPTWTPSRDKPLVIVSPLELGGDGLHIFVWVVQLVGCQVNMLWEHLA